MLPAAIHIPQTVFHLFHTYWKRATPRAPAQALLLLLLQDEGSVTRRMSREHAAHVAVCMNAAHLRVSVKVIDQDLDSASLTDHVTQLQQPAAHSDCRNHVGANNDRLPLMCSFTLKHTPFLSHSPLLLLLGSFSHIMPNASLLPQRALRGR